MLIIEQRNYFKINDKVNIFTPEKKEYTFTLENIYDEDNNPLECARHPRQIIKIPFSKEIPNNSFMRTYFFE